jgi:hypothetical protein
MKGQYVAVETVLTIGMGLSLAVGIIAVFGSYQDQVSLSTEEKEIETVEYRMQKAVKALENTDSGSIQVELPDTIAGASYTVALSEDLRVITPEKDYVKKIPALEGSAVSGSSEGGPSVLYKSNEEYILRSS